VAPNKKTLQTLQQCLYALVSNTVQLQSCQFFESMLPEQLFELKNEETVKKSENLRDMPYVLAGAYLSTLCIMAGFL
jgi:hypothetical protein